MPEGPPPPESPPALARWLNELPVLIELNEIREELNEIREEPRGRFQTPRTHARNFEAGLALKQFLVLSLCVITHVFSIHRENACRPNA